MSRPEAVTPVTLWLCECDGPGFESWRVESSDDVDVTLDRKFTALPAAQYAALVAERDALREKAERALNEVTCLRMSLRALSSLHPTHDVEYARTAAKRHEDNSWARYPVDAYGAALGAERA